MPYVIPRIDGTTAFGLVTSFQPSPIAARSQLDQFFGVPGQTRLFGGALGWTIAVSGVLEEFDIPTLNTDIAILTSFVDGNTHTVLDTSGNVWSNVYFDGEISFDPRGPMITDIGWCRAYSLMLRTLSP